MLIAYRRNIFRRSAVAGAAVAAVVGLSMHTALADSMPNVSTRSADQIERDFGRASGDAYWQAREPAPLPEPFVRAYSETKDFLTQPAPADGPERYGRAGGFVGMDKLQSPAWTDSSSMHTERGGTGG
jgi:hypothetical protein